MRIFGHARVETRAAVLRDHGETDVPARRFPVFGASFFQQIVERARCPLLVIEALSHDQTIVYASPAIEELTGYAPDELVGQDWRQILIRAAQSPADPMAGAARRDSTAEESFTMRHKDGAELRLGVSLSQLGADPAFLTHYIAVLSDVTAERRAREVLQCGTDKSGAPPSTGPALRTEGQWLAVSAGRGAAPGGARPARSSAGVIVSRPRGEASTCARTPSDDARATRSAGMGLSRAGAGLEVDSLYPRRVRT